MNYNFEYIKHIFNILNYKRKEKVVYENENLKLSIYNDCYYVINKNVYVIFLKDCCKNNLYSYVVNDKKINIYTIRVKNWDDESINYIIDNIKNTHIDKKIYMIHGFKLTNKILQNKKLFDNDIYHLSITPYLKNIECDKININYLMYYSGEHLSENNIPIKINEYNKNLNIILTFDSKIENIENDFLIKNNIYIKNCNSKNYLCTESLKLGKYVFKKMISK